MKTAWFWVFFFVITSIMSITGMGQKHTDNLVSHAGKTSEINR